MQELQEKLGLRPDRLEPIAMEDILNRRWVEFTVKRLT
jgi:hypothetical protein